MPFYSGHQGQLLIDDAKVAAVQSWSFQASQAILDTSSLGSTDRTIIPGIRSVSGTCRIFYYQSEPGTGGDVTRLLEKCVISSAGYPAPRGPGGVGETRESLPVKIKLIVADGTASGRYIEMRCFLTSISMTMSVGEILSADISFEVDGAPRSVVF